MVEVLILNSITTYMHLINSFPTKMLLFILQAIYHILLNLEKLASDIVDWLYILSRVNTFRVWKPNYFFVSFFSTVPFLPTCDDWLSEEVFLCKSAPARIKNKTDIFLPTKFRRLSHNSFLHSHKDYRVYQMVGKL